MFLHLFFLFYGSTISTYAHPVTGTELSQRKDPPGLEFLKEYDFELLSKADQGKHSETYNVVGGFLVGGERVPAIMKEIFDNDPTNKSKALKEIEYLGKPSVNLLLHWGRDEYYYYYVVVKNVREYDPPLKLLYEHYMEDDKLLAFDLLTTASNTVRDKLVDFAEKDDLLYLDFHLQNIFFDKSLQTAMPIDWGPPASEYHFGVEEIVNKERKKNEIQHLKAILLANLPRAYSIGKLEDELIKHGGDLRLGDRHREIYLNGIPYTVERTRIDRTTKTFKISGGFGGEPALMKMMKYEDGRTFRRELMEKGLFLTGERNSEENWYHIIFKDEKHQLD